MPDTNLLRDEIRSLSLELDEKHEENRTRLERMESNQIRLESNQRHFDECLDDLKKKLFGNGQPGALQVMEIRISKLEKWFWRATGAASLLYVLISMYYKR